MNQCFNNAALYQGTTNIALYQGMTSVVPKELQELIWALAPEGCCSRFIQERCPTSASPPLPQSSA
jgi:hypothetical protein